MNWHLVILQMMSQNIWISQAFFFDIYGPEGVESRAYE